MTHRRRGPRAVELLVSKAVSSLLAATLLALLAAGCSLLVDSKLDDKQRADGGPPDQAGPPDGTPIPGLACVGELQPLGALSDQPLPPAIFDVAVDGEGRPHVVLLGPGQQLHHRWLTPEARWQDEPVDTGPRRADMLSLVAGEGNTLHLFYRGQGTMTPLWHQVHRDQRWSAPRAVEGRFQDGPYAVESFAAARHQDLPVLAIAGPGFWYAKVVAAGDAFTYRICARDVPDAPRPQEQAQIAGAPPGHGGTWVVSARLQHPGVDAPEAELGLDLFDVWGDDQPCPEPQRQDAVVVPPQGALGAVTVDGEGTGHLLFASPVGAPPVLNYSQWSQTLSSPEPVDAVVPLSQSVALLGNGPVVVYTRETTSPALVVRWRDPAGGGGWIDLGPPLDVGGRRSRVVVDQHDRLHIVFDAPQPVPRDPPPMAVHYLCRETAQGGQS